MRVIIGLLMASLVAFNAAARASMSEAEKRKREATDPCSKYYYGEQTVKAMEACRAAAMKGDTEAQIKLGHLYSIGDYKLKIKRDQDSANKWYLKAAESGNPDGQVLVGDIYYEGRGVSRNVAEAVKWYGKAAKQENPLAQLDMGILYYRGEGVPKNFSTALEWMLKSAANGNAEAQFNAGSMYLFPENGTADYKSAIVWFRKSAEQGYVMGEHYYAMILSKGYDNVPPNLKEAFPFYERASRQGLPISQYFLGLMYSYGLDIPKDYEKGLLWLYVAGMGGKNNPYSPENTLVKMPKADYDSSSEAAAAASHLSPEQVASVKKQAETLYHEVSLAATGVDIEFSANPLHGSTLESDLNALADYKKSLEKK